MAMKELIERWVAAIPEKIDRIMKNKLVMAVGLLFQGISMLLHPDRVPGGIVQSIGTTMILSSLLYLGTAIFSKRELPDLSTVLTTLIIASVGGAVFYFHQALAPFLRYGLGIALLLMGGTGLTQLTQLKHLERLGNLALRRELVPRNFPKTQVTDEVEKAAQEQISKNLSPALNLLKRLNKASFGSWLTNSITFLLGLAVLMYPFESGDMLFRFSGIAITFTGLTDLGMAMMLKWRKCAESEGK